MLDRSDACWGTACASRTSRALALRTSAFDTFRKCLDVRLVRQSGRRPTAPNLWVHGQSAQTAGCCTWPARSYPYGARVRLAAARKSDRRDASYNEDASLARTARRWGAPLFHYFATKLGANRADPQVEHSFLPTADRSASKSSRPAFDDFIDPIAPELTDATASFAGSGSVGDVRGRWRSHRAAYHLKRCSGHCPGRIEWRSEGSAV